MFKCCRCGACCKNVKNLAIFEWEKERIEECAKKLNINCKILPAIFVKYYNAKVILQWKLVVNRKCPFFKEDERICTIYENRPLVCKAFPLAHSGLTSNEIKEIIGSECKFAKIPFKKNEKIKKYEVVKRLYDEYGEIYIFAIKLDTLRLFLIDLLKYYNEEIKEKIKRIGKDTGLIEILRNLYPEIDEEIEKIIAGPVGFEPTTS